MTFTFQGRLQDLIASYSAHLSAPAREALGSLPPGWIEPVRNMVDRVEQILGEAEFGTFRWTAFDKKRSGLVATWAGAGDSEVLIDQIVEEASGEAARCCVECGSATLIGGTYDDGPRCLFHAALQSGRSRAKAWELTTIELVDALSEKRRSLEAVSPKTIAAALPMMIEAAADYYRSPDQDAHAISRQIQEAYDRLEKHLSGLGAVGAAQPDH